jgi:murein DD-endopeptidase MepM/ murein hydrolase activator NlpD
MNYYNYNRFVYKRKNNKYLEGFTKRLAAVAVIFILMFTIKITYTYNGNTVLFKIEEYYRKDYTQTIKNIVSHSNYISVFSNKIFQNKKEIFKLDFMPLDGQVIKPFGEYIEPSSKKSFFNNGIDIEVKDSCNVLCVYDGIIEKVENTKDNGIVVTVSHKDNYKTIYYNLIELNKDVGEEIKKGDILGKVDNEKNKSFHFEVMHSGSYVDPLKSLSNR